MAEKRAVGDTVKWDGNSRIDGEIVIRVIESGGDIYAITTGAMWLVKPPATVAPEEDEP